MSQSCSIHECDQVAFAECNCCHQLICKYHLSEHYNRLNDEFNQLVSELNTFSEYVRSFDKKKLTLESREILDQWRFQCHQKIDEIYDEKVRRIDTIITEKIDEQSAAMNKLESRVEKTINEQETNNNDEIRTMSLELDRLKNEMVQIEQIYIQVRINQIPIDENSIHVNASYRPPIDICQLFQPWKEIKHSAQVYNVFSSNENSLLIHQPPNLCRYNEDIELLQKVPWPFGPIINICWSSVLERFIVLNDRSLFLVSEDLSLLRKYSLTKSSRWSSCDCSDSSVFLSNNESMASIFVVKIGTNFELIDRWIYPTKINENVSIDSLCCTKETLALLLRNSTTKLISFELRFSSTFDCVWKLSLDIIYQRDFRFRCCSLSFNEWLIADYQNELLLHIAKSGHFKEKFKYATAPYGVHLFKQNLLIISTKSGKNIHRIG